MDRRALGTYLLRRVALLALMLVVFSFLIFSLMHLAPGSPEQALLGSTATPERIAALRAEYGLDDPFIVQYLRWAGKAVQLDFGQSYLSSSPVISLIGQRAGLTVLLGSIAFVLTMGVGVTLGVLAAVRRGSTVDRAVVGSAAVAVSAPSFATGILLIYVFAVVLGIFPALGGGRGFVDRLWHLVLPAVTLALAGVALVVRYTRAAMVEALGQDYVQFARAGGLPERRVIVAHGLRNALIPVVTSASIILAFVLTNAIIVEVTFNLPGIGSLLIDAVRNKDLPLVQGVVLCIALVIFAINLVTDLIYAAVDPRIRLGAVT